MASSADRAINMALRVRGIDAVERDFKRLGDGGEKSFSQIKKSANGAAQEVSDYTARLRRAVEIAKGVFANIPDFNKGPADVVRQRRNEFVLGAVEQEKLNILQGVPDQTRGILGLDSAVEGLGSRFLTTATLAAGFGAALIALKNFTFDSAEALIEHEQALSRFEATLSLAGNQSNATADDIRGMAERIVESTLQTEEAALGAAAALARVPGITREGLEAALEASALLADALGTDVTETAAATAEVLTALAEEDMKALLKATEDLNPQTRAVVLQLAELGKTADAQRVYLEALTRAAGDGPGGLAKASNDVGDAWRRVKLEFAEEFSGTAVTGLNLIADALDFVGNNAAAMRDAALSALGPVGRLTTVVSNYLKASKDEPEKQFTPAKGGLTAGLQAITNTAANLRVKQFEEKYGGGSSGRKSGSSAGNREAERLAREAERARDAADRVIESNQDVIESYQRRAQETAEKVGLEGAALEAAERAHAVDAAARRINIELIEKEVEARRAAAAAAGKPFDEASATAEATRMVEAQSAAVRAYANDLEDANRDLEDWNRRQREAAAILETVKDPFERVNDEVERSIGLLRTGAIEADAFDSYMKVLADEIAVLSYRLDENAQVWRGFGNDVGRTLSDIALNGGSALEIVQELIRLPLERLLYQNVETPIAKWIDGLTGNDLDKRAGEVKLPQASDVAAANVTMLAGAADQAALALYGIPGALGTPIDQFAIQSDRATEALGGLVPATGQFGAALNQVLAQLSGGGGGGGGFLGLLLTGAGALAGGGVSAGAVARLAPDAASTIAANPALFASGTDRVPIGRPFEVGENGRERMTYLGGDRLRVESNQQVRRFRSEPAAGATIIQNISIPERADPRVTGSALARGTQTGLARANRSNIAAAARRPS